MASPRETVEQILQTARIEEVVGEFVTLKKKGSNLWGNCPFHNEKTPSFSVNPARNIFIILSPCPLTALSAQADLTSMGGMGNETPGYGTREPSS